MAGKKNAGFTLLEMMISFVILTIAITSIYKALSTGLTRANEQMLRYEATEIAISLIAESEVTRPITTIDGEIGDKWRWTVIIEPVTPIDNLPPNIRFSQIVVQVFYRNAATPTTTLARTLPAETVP